MSHIKGKARKGTLAIFSLVAVAALVIAALTITTTAQAQTTLVSNLGQSPFTTADHQGDRSQSFKTGSNATGYALGDVWIKSTGTVGFDAAIWETDSDGAPSTLLHTLTAPTTFASGTLVFTAPANARLVKDTTYAVRIIVASQTTVSLGRTTSDDEDAGGSGGWEIGDVYHFWNSATNAWAETGTAQSLGIAILAAEGTVDLTPPALTTGHQVFESGNAILVEFDEALEGDLALAPPPSAFTVKADGEVIPVTAVTPQGFIFASQLSLTLGQIIAQGQTATVSYADPTAGDDAIALQDEVGNDVVSFTDLALINNSTVDLTPPALTTGHQVFESGNAILVEFDEALEGDLALAPPPSAFTVKADGEVIPVTAVTPQGFISASQLSLTLGQIIAQGQTATVSYADPTAGDDAIALQDEVGNDVVSFTDLALTNNSTVSTVATLNGLALKNAADDSALTLNETFASTLTSYTADVPYGVTSITIEPTKSHNNATVAYLNASDTALVDADTNKTGFQVTLAPGANTIKVKVTAEAGAAYTETYTVVVTRETSAPTVTISAGQTSATFKEDSITYTLSHSGLTTVAVPVTVLLEQTKNFLAAAELTKTVTIPAGQSTETFTVAAASFQQFAAGTPVEGGTLTAMVVDGADYDLGTPSSVDVAIVIGVTVRFEQASYTVSEADGSLVVKAIGRTRPGEPRPTSNTGDINLGLTDGTAINLTDYFSIDTVTFGFVPASYSLQSDGVWQAVKTYGITVTDDDLDEDDETFTVTLEYRLANDDRTPLVDASGNSCGTECSVTVIITDDDRAGVTVSKSALTVMEEDATGDTYTVVLDSEPTADVTISIGGQTGTDVTVFPSPMTFTTLNWETAQTVTVTAANDTDTTNDTVTLTHSAASTDSSYSGITIADVTVTVDDNDDTTPASSDATLSGLTVNDGANDLTLIPAFTPETYDYAASVSNDVTAVTLSATVNDTGAEVTGVTLNGNTIADTDFSDGIAVPSLIAADNEIVVTVTAEDDTTTQDYTVTVTREPPLPVLSFAAINITVNEEAGPAVLTVNLSPASAVPITVDYETRQRTGARVAQEGEDYTATSGTLTFAPHETSKTISVPIIDDNVYENLHQRFDVYLLNSFLASLPSSPFAAVNIVSDDPAPTASMQDVIASEKIGTMTLTLRLSHPSDEDISYNTNASLLSGTAARGDDYENFLSGGDATITVPAGRLSGTFDITIIDDGVEENDETIIIQWNLFGSGATPGSIFLTGTITDPAQCDNVADTIIVKNLTGEITQAGASQFHNIKLDPFKSYLMEAIGVDGRDMLEVEEHSNLTLEDPAIPALWNAKGTSKQNTFGSTGHDNGFGKNVIRGINKTDYRTYKIEVASGDNGTGTYQLKVRVNNICRLNDDEEAHYHWAGGPKGYPNFDLPAGTGGRHVLFIGTHNDDRVERAELHHVLGDNWDSAPDVDWFGADLEQGKRYSIRLRTKTGLPERLQATQLKILGIYDSDGNAVSNSPSSGVGKKVFVTNWQVPARDATTSPWARMEPTGPAPTGSASRGTSRTDESPTREVRAGRTRPERSTRTVNIIRAPQTRKCHEIHQKQQAGRSNRRRHHDDDRHSSHVGAGTPGHRGSAVPEAQPTGGPDSRRL